MFAHILMLRRKTLLLESESALSHSPPDQNVNRGRKCLVRYFLKIVWLIY